MPELDRIHRDVVETANAAVRRAAESDDPLPFLCECGDLDCTRVVLFAPSEYDRLRRSLVQQLLHPLCKARDERAALLSENRLLRARLKAQRALLRLGTERMRGLLPSKRT